MRLAVVTNMLAPYRMPQYRALAELVDELTIFTTGDEHNRFWEIESEERAFAVRSVPGFVLERDICRAGISAFDTRYRHVPLGLIPALARYNPDAVVTTEMGIRSLLVWLYCAAQRKPVVVHFGGTLHSEQDVRGLRDFVRRRFFARRIPAWVSYGAASTDYLASLGIGRDRIFEATNCVDYDFFAKPAQACLFLRPKPVLLSVGRFVPLKGLVPFLQATRVLRDRGRHFSILLVGSGPQERELRRLVSRLGLTDVVFHPFVQKASLPGVYRSADLLVFPTLQDVWGLVVNEALASGLPVLCSKYAGCAADLVPENWRFDPLNVKGSFVPALEKALRRLADGRREFPAVSELRGPRETACAIMQAVAKASGGTSSSTLRSAA